MIVLYKIFVLRCAVMSSSTGKDLGVMLESNLSFEKHISSVSRASFFHLINIAKL